DNGRFSIGEAGENTPFKVYPGAVTNLLRVGLGGSNDRIDIPGDIQMTGTITTGGSCSIGCDRVFDQDYEVASIADHNAAMWANGYLPNVGPTVEDGQYNMSEKVLRMLNELEHAHIYIGQMHERIAVLEARIEKLK
ncbi:MAG: hypothetical protein GY947_02795, partial [Rhodobacteraceae bacterium]|nr:hypothetical protein [Paracoccaceae bacterium]